MSLELVLNHPSITNTKKTREYESAQANFTDLVFDITYSDETLEYVCSLKASPKIANKFIELLEKETHPVAELCKLHSFHKGTYSSVFSPIREEDIITFLDIYTAIAKELAK